MKHLLSTPERLHEFSSSRFCQLPACGESGNEQGSNTDQYKEAFTNYSQKVKPDK